MAVVALKPIRAAIAFRTGFIVFRCDDMTAHFGNGRSNQIQTTAKREILRFAAHASGSLPMVMRGS